ncbi:MAG: PH domain-containing protein [Acidimicrobiales bacterium]|nr:PH domain-containing protein [Acidimicrobiales bacterium]
MAFSNDLLNDQEQVVLDLRPHWWFFFKPIAFLFAGIALGVAVLAWDGSPLFLNLVVAVALLAALGWFGLNYLRWVTTNFIVTSDRLIARSGVFNRSGIEIPLEKINTVFFRQNLFERLIRSGDLEIESASEEGTQDFSNIRRPLNVQNEIYRQMELNENRKFDRVGRNLDAQISAATAKSAAASIPDQIAQLDDLRQRGIITKAEFQAKKAELLKRL